MTIEFSNWDIVRGFFIEIIVVRLLLVYLCASLSIHYLLLFLLILCLPTCLFHSTLHCLTISHFVHLKLPTLLVWLSLSVYSHMSVYLSYYLHMVIRLFIFFSSPSLQPTNAMEIWFTETKIRFFPSCCCTFFAGKKQWRVQPQNV